MLIGDLWRALKAGEELTNSAAWKNRQATTSAVAAILGLLVAILPRIGVSIDVSADDVAAIAGGVAVVLGLCSNYLTLATSKRVGLPADDKGASPPGSGAAIGVGD